MEPTPEHGDTVRPASTASIRRALGDAEQQLERTTAESERYRNFQDRLHILFKKHKGYIGSIQKLGTFKEPVMLLERRNGVIEFYENITKKEWMVPDEKAAEGEERIIYLNAPPKRFSYAGGYFTGYICHEDYAFPLNWDQEKAAQINSESLRDLMRKVLVAWEKYKTTAQAQYLQGWAKVILYIIAGLAGLYFIYTMFGGGGDATTTIIQQAPVPPNLTAIVG